MVDAELVAQALAGDAAGIAGMYDRYGDRIHDYARSMLRNDADAADVTQDTFLVGAQRLSQLRDPAKLRPWLYAIARSQALRILRTRQRVESSDDVDSVFEMTSSEGAIDAQRLVRAAADGLEDSDRDVLDLHLRHGLEGQELAEVLGVTANAANVTLHRVRERFEQAATAVLLSAAPPGECDEFDQLVAPGLSPLVRKRVARHIEGCAICQDRKKRARPFAAFAAIPLVDAPAGLRDQVLLAVGTSQGLAAASQIDWAPDGFPAATPPVAGPAGSEAPRGPQPDARAALSAPRLALAGVGMAAAVLLTFLLFRTGGETTVELVSEAQIAVAAVPVFEPTATPSPEPAPTADPSATPVATATVPPSPTVPVVPPAAEPPATSTPVPVAPPPVAPPPPTATAIPTPTATAVPTATPTAVPTPIPTAVPTPSPTPTVGTPPVITPISFFCQNPLTATVDVESTGALTVVLEWTNDSASGSVVMTVQSEITGYHKGTVAFPNNSYAQARVVATNSAGSTIYEYPDTCVDFE